MSLGSFCFSCGHLLCISSCVLCCALAEDPSRVSTLAVFLVWPSPGAVLFLARRVSVHGAVCVCPCPVCRTWRTGPSPPPFSIRNDQTHSVTFARRQIRNHAGFKEHVCSFVPLLAAALLCRVSPVASVCVCDYWQWVSASVMRFNEKELVFLSRQPSEKAAELGMRGPKKGDGNTHTHTTLIFYLTSCEQQLICGFTL